MDSIPCNIDADMAFIIRVEINHDCSNYAASRLPSNKTLNSCHILNQISPFQIILIVTYNLTK
jgi:hypothetical protein